MSMEYDSAEYLVWKSFFSIKSFGRRHDRQSWVMYRNMSKGSKSIKSSFPLYQTYTNSHLET